MDGSVPKVEEEQLKYESEIRVLKVELLKQQLDERLADLRLYLDRKQQVSPQSNQNVSAQSSNLTTTSLAPSTDDEPKPFESVLFEIVFGEFEVWHFVVLIFVTWFLMRK